MLPRPSAAQLPALTAKLATGSFAEYLQTLEAVDSRKEWPNDLSRQDFVLLMRPYYWYVYDPGFQDLMDACALAHGAISRNFDLLSDELSMSGLPQFLESYIVDEALDGTGWSFLSCSPELAAAIDAETAAQKLVAAGRAKDAKLLEALARVLKALEGAKHKTYWKLRELASRFVEELDLVHRFHPADQGFVLHALDEFKKDKKVIAFLERFIEQTPSESLKEEAAGYLEAVR